MPRRKKEEPVEEPVEDETEAQQDGTEEETLMTSGGEKLVVHKTEDSEEIGRLYESYSTITESEKPEDCEDAFQTILDAAKSTLNCKKLAVQFIPKFFKSFENLEKKAISAMFDLIEEEEQANELSVGAIKGLGKMCQEIPKYVQQVTQFLGQLIFGEQSDIKKAAEECITQISTLNVEGSIEGFLGLTLDDESEEVKKSTFQFFEKKLFQKNRKAILGNEKVEDMIDEAIKSYLKDASNISAYSRILFQLNKYKASGAQDLLDTFALQGGFDELDEYDEAVLKKLITFRVELIRLGERDAKVLPYYTYCVEQVLPKFDELEIETQIELLKVIASLSTFASPSATRKTLPVIYDLMLKYLPQKPEEGEASFNFSFVECLLFTFHQLAPKIISELNPICGIQFATGQPGQDMSDHSDKRKDLNDRLRFFRSKTHAFKKRIVKPVRIKNATPEQFDAYRQSMSRFLLIQKMIDNLIDLASSLLVKGVPKFINAKSFALSFSPRKRRAPKRKAQNQKSTQPFKRKRFSGRGRGRGRGRN